MVLTAPNIFYLSISEFVMRRRRISRRSFLKQAALATAIGSAATVIGPAVGRLWANESLTRREADLLSALQAALGDQVGGVEKSHDIPHRLAINLATMTGPKPEMVARQQILLLAAQQVPKDHKLRPSTQPMSVSGNLNDLLNTIRGQRAASQLISTLLNEVATTVLFSTHGIHFDDTRNAQKAFRAAVLALKDTTSNVPVRTRIRNKKQLLVAYRSSIHTRARQVVLAGFPPTATIQSAWIMTDYKLPKRT
jgi:hypothetical protein